MVKHIKLNFMAPVGDRVTSGYGTRRGGFHYGMDYGSALGTSVKASEDGIVVRASFNPRGSGSKGSYGNVVIIDHTPDVKDYERHIYTLYAHLDTMSVGVGDEVERGEEIGKSGNTGTRGYYKGKERGAPKRNQRGYYLHFEVVDHEKAIKWQKTGATGISGSLYREDPQGYFNQEKVLEYPVLEEEAQRILGKLDIEGIFRPRHKDMFRLCFKFDGKDVGYLSSEKKTIKFEVPDSALR